ncbi:hypothetical protein HDV05_001877 [Chytridiales sp. JEL 0842]|nr:hypothetical protein HDV05_001877 [Chytridiales sp. JEL 0842]
MERSPNDSPREASPTPAAASTASSGTGAPTYYCHQCEVVFPSSSDTPKCSYCDSDFVEIIDPSSSDPRDFHASTVLGNSMYDFGEFGANGRSGASGLETAPIVDLLTQLMQQTMLNSNSGPSGRPLARPIPPRTGRRGVGDTNESERTDVGDSTSTSGSSNPSSGATGSSVPSAGFGVNAGFRFNSSGFTPYAFPRPAGASATSASSSRATDYASSRTSQPDSSSEEDDFEDEIETPADPRRALDDAFNAFVGHIGGDNRIASLFHEVITRGLQNGSTFQFFGSGPMAGNPGDYVFSQRRLDEIISQLMEQSQGNGPPPASEESLRRIPKVKVRGVDLGEHPECAICQDHFTDEGDGVGLLALYLGIKLYRSESMIDEEILGVPKVRKRRPMPWETDEEIEAEVFISSKVDMMVNGLEWFLVGLGVLNAMIMFTKSKSYTLLHQPTKPPATDPQDRSWIVRSRNARLVKVELDRDSLDMGTKDDNPFLDERSSTSMSETNIWFSWMPKPFKSIKKASSRKKLEYRWVLRVWDPPKWSLRIFCWFSPATIAALYGATNSLAFILSALVINSMVYMLITAFQDRLSDQQILHGQFEKEYSRFVYTLPPFRATRNAAVGGDEPLFDDDEYDESE